MSRKKLPSEKVREENEEAGGRRSCREAGGSDRETPTKASKKHSRSRKPGGTQLPTSNASLLTKSEREEVELCLNKKTPKRLSKNKLWSSTINSPSNDADQQHEIFWDPHSPTPFKLENGRRKQTSSKCAVDISDIVNRIAPKDEKPANKDAGYLGMWIGDDAIPSTPVVARPRTKISRSRIIKKEDELMKLAKQFDKNMVDTVQFHDQYEHMGHSEVKTAYVGSVKNNDHVPFMDNIPEEAPAPKLESACQVQSSVRAQPSSQSSQRSVDQEAEAALNALFDSSTQKYSGQLSQGLSDVSANSSQDPPIKAKDNTNEKHLHAKDHSEICEKPSSSKQNTCQLNTLVSKNNPKQDVIQQKSLEWTSVNPKVSNATDDFDDDWETDFLDDDSFVMQITQNPSLIATPKDDSPASNFCLNDPISLAAESPKIPKAPTQCMDSSSGLNKLNNFKFVPRTSNPGVVEKPITNKPEKVCILNKAVDINEGENVNAKLFSNAVSRVPLKSQVNSVQSVTKHTNTPAVGEHLPKSETPKECKKTRSFTTPTSHCLQSSLPVKTSPQTVQAKHTGNINKSSAHHDEWDDPKFSDEVLDMFCESDSLWETNEEDDDLLYQVCDDVEKLSQAQVEDKVDKCENMHSAGSDFKNSTNVGVKTNQGQLVQKYKEGTQITAASVATSVVNKCNGPFLPFTASTNKATTHLGGYRTRGNSLTASQNDLRRNSQVTLSRSTSVPVGGQCSYSRRVPSGPLLQHPVRHESAASSSKSSLAPSKYSFTRIKPSQLSVLHSNSTQVVEQNNSKDFTFQDIGVNEKESNVFFQGNVKPCQQPSLKRHLSESLLQSAKVFVSEERNKKCSMEEIERKKQEALARRQMKARTFSNECART